MLPHAQRSLVLTALALLAACGSDGPLGPTGGTFTPGQSLAVESGRDVRVVSDGSAGTYIATVLNQTHFFTGPLEEIRRPFSWQGEMAHLRCSYSQYAIPTVRLMVSG